MGSDLRKSKQTLTQFLRLRMNNDYRHNVKFREKNGNNRTFSMFEDMFLKNILGKDYYFSPSTPHYRSLEVFATAVDVSEY